MAEFTPAPDRRPPSRAPRPPRWPALRLRMLLPLLLPLLLPACSPSGGVITQSGWPARGTLNTGAGAPDAPAAIASAGAAAPRRSQRLGVAGVNRVLRGRRGGGGVFGQRAAIAAPPIRGRNARVLERMLAAQQGRGTLLEFRDQYVVAVDADGRVAGSAERPAAGAIGADGAFALDVPGGEPLTLMLAERRDGSWLCKRPLEYQEFVDRASVGRPPVPALLGLPETVPGGGRLDLGVFDFNEVTANPAAPRATAPDGLRDDPALARGAFRNCGAQANAVAAPVTGRLSWLGADDLAELYDAFGLLLGVDDIAPDSSGEFIAAGVFDGEGRFVDANAAGEAAGMTVVKERGRDVVMEVFLTDVGALVPAKIGFPLLPTVDLNAAIGRPPIRVTDDGFDYGAMAGAMADLSGEVLGLTRGASAEVFGVLDSEEILAFNFAVDDNDAFGYDLLLPATGDPGGDDGSGAGSGAGSSDGGGGSPLRYYLFALDDDDALYLPDPRQLPPDACDPGGVPLYRLDAAGPLLLEVDFRPDDGSLCALPNTPPSVTLRAAPPAGPAPLTVAFTADASDPDGDPLRYDWDFGDGGVAVDAGPALEHTFASAGAFEVRVTVSDGVAAAEAAVTVEVAEAVPFRGEWAWRVPRLAGTSASGRLSVSERLPDGDGLRDIGIGAWSVCLGDGCEPQRVGFGVIGRDAVTDELLVEFYEERDGGAEPRLLASDDDGVVADGADGPTIAGTGVWVYAEPAGATEAVAVVLVRVAAEPAVEGPAEGAAAGGRAGFARGRW